VKFGNDRDVDLYTLAEGIQTFSEQERTDQYRELRSWIFESDLVLSVGFGYLRENLKLLRPSVNSNKHRRVIGSAFEVSRPNLDLLRTEVGAAVEAQDVAIDNIRDSKGLISDFSRVLEAA
jgi:hypothetical protein